jgi:hypothetical protein
MYLNGVENDGMPTWVVKVAKKPSITISNTTHQFVAHTFNYPGRITWDPVEVTIVDPVLPDASEILVKILQGSGYTIPSSPNAALTSFSRANSQGALGLPRLAQIDAAGNQLDEWTLKNAWIERVDFGQLDYTNEEMVNITLSIRYDYAEYRKGLNATPVMTAGQDVGF